MHVFLGTLNDRALTSLNTASVRQLGYRLAKFVYTVSIS